MNPHIAEEIIAERVKSFHQEAAARRRVRTGRRVTGFHWVPFWRVPARKPVPNS